MSTSLKLVPSSEDRTPSSQEGYRVLARKYRPKSLGEVIGQDFLVETLKRGLEGGRLGHAFILTGIRGTGKTTTARILARSLNCEKGPTAEPCGTCASCLSITEDRSLDVIEIDAASRTGVEDVRDIIEASHYKAVASPYKIYIIDEVHMLSKSAFNALLKTLEEPPAHVKFIFATTEIHKVPSTILSRCVRFDLKRIEAPTLAAYFKTLSEKENISVEEEALALIAKAAEGSVRDGLSLLDQAMTHGTTSITANQVRQMLGLSDHGELLLLFETLAEGNCQKALEKGRYFYQEGADPVRLVEELLELTHWLHCLKMSPTLAEDASIPPEKRQKGQELATALTVSSLSRLWQMLLKGLEEVKRAPSPQQALEVLIIRLTHLAPLPSLEEIIKGLPSEEPSKKKVLSQETSKEIPHFPTFESLVDWVSHEREGLLHAHLLYDVHLVSYTPPEIVLRLSDKAPSTLPQQLKTLLKTKTEHDWTIAISDEIGHSTLHEQAETKREERRQELLATPLVKKVMEKLPGTTLVNVEEI